MKRLTHSLIAATIVLAACDAWAATKLFTQTTAPATCTVGDLWVDTNGTSGERLYTCESTNTWALHLGVGPTSNPSFLSLNASGGNLAAANKQVTKAWASGLPYTADVTSVIHGGEHYICTSNHTAESTTEPGVGASWATVWKVASGAGDDLGDAAYSDVVALWTTCSGYLKSDGSCDTPSGGYTNLTSFIAQTNWRVFYSNGSGDVTELALGADGTYLKSNGASSAPTWATPSGSMVYPGAGIPNSTGSAWGTSYTLDTDLSTVSASDDTIPSAKAVKAQITALPSLAAGTGITITEDGGGAGIDTIGVTLPVSAEAWSGSGWNGDTGGLARNDAYDYLHIADTDDDGLPNKVDVGDGIAKVASNVLVVATAGIDYSVPSGTETLTNKTITGEKYTAISSTSQGTGNINLDGTAAADYSYSNSTSATYTPVFTSLPSAGTARSIVATFGGGTGAITMDWANVNWVGETAPTAIAANDSLTISCIVRSGGAYCSAPPTTRQESIGWTIKDSDVVTAVADGKQAAVIPSSMNGMNLTDLTCSVADLNSAASGTTTVVLRRVRGATAADMTSTGVTIDYNEYSASDETVDTANDDVATGDKIYVDVNAVTTAAQKGLSCTAVFQTP